MNPNFRSWMYENRFDSSTGLVSAAYGVGLTEFMRFATQQQSCIESGMLFCPCSRCNNNRFIVVEKVWNHLYRVGFTPNYRIWCYHGELDRSYIGSSSEAIPHVNTEPIPTIGADVEMNSTIHMVNDAFTQDIPNVSPTHENRSEVPNTEAMSFFNMLNAAKHPIYDGCKHGHSPLSAATRMMSIKTDYNLSEDCMDAIAGLVKDYLPEDNVSPASYYEIEKLVAGIGLPYERIDVCIANCMLFWRGDSERETCRFCGKPRFQPNRGKSRVPFKRMWYLPLAARLQRLYQSQRTAKEMRWHAEHEDCGEVTHPSDALAWKHFRSMYPDFAAEPRNVYLGLCTDGFNPFGKYGRQYSLWPVIVTPYNLPPTLCMNREFLFLSVLVPGPEHPKRSLDVFLQPLIYELQGLWYSGVEAFDVSKGQNFRMHAVLMWTISDFPAYGMLSGWTTQGRLSCPYCQDETDAFHLRHGKKTSWFDCHRRFLQSSHPYRRSKTLFTRNKVVKDGPPPVLDGSSILTQLRDFGAERTSECGGNCHERLYGVGEYHNWHKKSIFWDLPYWKDHLLRHNLDVMHIEKNFFENIINTVLNVKGKTKDNINSRLDLPSLCCRPELHVMEDGKGPVPIFRLNAAAKDEFFRWITEEVQFPDGYAANLRNCVDHREGKFIGMKSHDCHVFMQRLLPFVFSGLLPKKVHEAIAGIGSFFRDLSSRSFSEDGMRYLDQNIPIILCNLEKLFPPSFFDVMEHLPIHLPHEALLGGPVQFRWMYPFERFMFHLKKKVKNLSRVEGSIVAQSINEETSHFSSFYFAPEVQTKSRKPSRHDDGGEIPIYPSYVPNIFAQVGRLVYKTKKRWITDKERHHLHTYLLMNCEDVFPYERLYVDQLRSSYPSITDEEIEDKKLKELSSWLQFYVYKSKMSGLMIPLWLEELVEGPLPLTMSSRMYATRGYSFKIYREEDHIRSTINSGVCSQSGNMIFYGRLLEILEVQYAGSINMKCVVFLCDWVDSREGVGVRQTKFGVTEVNSSKRLNRYDPFILASQADQVTYISYPRVSSRNDPWVIATKVYPRGRVLGAVPIENPLQEPFINSNVGQFDQSMENTPLVDLREVIAEDLEDVYDQEGGEDEAQSDPSMSAYSSDSET